jgi:hypothetical protein
MLAQLMLAALALQGGDGPRPLKVFARGTWPYGPAAGGCNEFVLRSVAELVAASPQKKDDLPPAEARRQALADLTKALKVKEIDWKKQMLVVVCVPRAHPFRPAAIARLDVSGKTLTVHYEYYAPVAARPQDRPPTPATVPLLALVERFDGPVQFRGERRFPR